METGQMRRSEDRITIHTLDSGLRIVHRHSPGAAVDYCGAIIHVGSRNDEAQVAGMAHFVEHTIFKGTERRQSWHIINRMERVGGELNAYTTKEETVVYTAAPSGYVGRALELIADLVTSSRFPESELNKEREVVADEINSYLDSPADAVFDDFEDLVFVDTPLGHNILGNTEAISHITSTICRDYLHKWYTSQNMVIFYFGSAHFERFKNYVQKYFCSLPTHSVDHVYLPEGFISAPFDTSKEIGSHQAHTVMGKMVGGMYSTDRYVLALITNILGGPGMNSLLNVSLREKRGLVYSVEASTGLMHDCGLFTIYFGCDPADTDRCKELVYRQLDQLSRDLMNDSTLKAAKKQYLGQLAVASDNRESMAISTGRSTMYFNDVMTSADLISRINTITPEDICRVTSGLKELSSLTLK